VSTGVGSAAGVLAGTSPGEVDTSVGCGSVLGSPVEDTSVGVADGCSLGTPVGPVDGALASTPIGRVGTTGLGVSGASNVSTFAIMRLSCCFWSSGTLGRPRRAAARCWLADDASYFRTALLAAVISPLT
jgi:hypothetical protein